MKDLINLTAFCGVSKITGRVFKGYDSQVESDLTRLKKGIRANDSLTMHEAFFRVMDRYKLIDVFRQMFSGLEIQFRDGQDCMIRRAQSTMENCKKNASIYENDRSQSGREYFEFYTKEAVTHSRMLDAYSFLKKYEQDALDELKTIPQNRSHLIDWKNLTSVQFYQYDAATNSFVEIN